MLAKRRDRLGESKGLTNLGVVQDAISPLPPGAIREPRATISV